MVCMSREDGKCLGLIRRKFVLSLADETTSFHL